MSDKKLATSKFTLTVKVGAILVLLLLLLVIFLFYMALRGTKPDLGYTAGACIVFTFTALPLYSILSLAKIEVYEDYLILKKIFGFKSEKIFKTNISHWGEKTIPTQDGKYYTLRLYLNNKYIDISQEEYKNYHDLKRHLIVGITDTSEQRQKKFNRNQLIIATTVISIFILLFWALWVYSFIKPADIVTKPDTLSITDVITNKPSIYSNKSSHSIDIKLQTFPDYIFKVEGNSYQAMAAKNFVNDIEPFDTIQVRVKKEQFVDKEREINDTTNFWAKDETETLFVYEVSNKKYTYLSIENYNKEAIADEKFDIFFFLISLLNTIIGSIYLIKIWKRGSLYPAKK